MERGIISVRRFDDLNTGRIQRPLLSIVAF
jgi:hypothetical protein